MADVRVVMSPTLIAELRAAEHPIGDQLAEAILADMQAITPVLTGALRDSERVDQVDDGGAPEWRIGPHDLPYALATEFGFHGMEWVREYVTRTGRVVAAHARRGNTPEQPYMRPALYTVRTP